MARAERDRWMREFLATEAEAQTRMLTGLRLRLERGQAAADPKSTAPPSREWVRAARMYLDGYRALATLELEHAKVKLMARKAGMDALTDEEYAKELVELGRDAVRSLPDDELRAELERRAMALAAGHDP